MSNIKNRTMRMFSFTILIISLIGTTLIALTTYNADPNHNYFVALAVKHHMLIMVGLLLISITFGFASANMFYTKLLKEKQGSKKILEVVLLFLSKEEKDIIEFLVEKNGITTQAEIARLPKMSRVKAHRSIQKMEQKQLIEIIPHGKIRKLKLKDNIFKLITEK